MEVGKLVEIMCKQWHMERPNLLISVTGGAKDFAVKPELMEVFRHGLIKAAESTGTFLSLHKVYCYSTMLPLNN